MPALAQPVLGGGDQRGGGSRRPRPRTCPNGRLPRPPPCSAGIASDQPVDLRRDAADRPAVALGEEEGAPRHGRTTGCCCGSISPWTSSLSGGTQFGSLCVERGTGRRRTPCDRPCRRRSAESSVPRRALVPIRAVHCRDAAARPADSLSRRGGGARAGGRWRRRRTAARRADSARPPRGCSRG